MRIAWLTVFNIIKFGLLDKGAIFQPAAAESDVSDFAFRLPEDPPNIFYILVDAYTRADTLDKYFGYDNSEFIKYLEDTGFKVARNSNANYYFTYLATRALLNFEYVKDGSDIEISDDENLDKIFNNRVGAIFQDLGYSVITLQSVGQYVRTAGATDVTLNSRWLTLNEFDTAVLDTTMLPRLSGDYAQTSCLSEAKLIL